MPLLLWIGFTQGSGVNPEGKAEKRIDGSDGQWMDRALEEARKGLGSTSPNPPVGAVVVQGRELIGVGYHARAGEPHAEVMALRDAGEALRGAEATLYVTLEPCSTQGRTPPCVETILTAGVARVVVGCVDPDPRHAGRGIEWLRERGVEVGVGVRQAECERLIEFFAHWVRTRQPFVIAKAAVTLDGKLNRPPGEGTWISSPEARQDVHRLRAQVDAILVGAQTVRVDDPELTVREVELPGPRQQPWRVIWSRRGKIPPESKVLSDAHRERTIVSRQSSVGALLEDLGKRDILSVLVEGGGVVLAEFFASGLVNRAVFYVAPLLCGGGKSVVDPVVPWEHSLSLCEVETMVMGDNVKMVGTPSSPPPKMG